MTRPTPSPPSVSRSDEPAFAHDPWFRVYIDEVNSASRHYRHARIVESGGTSGVVVVPVTGNRIGLVRQYRVPIDAVTWELPRGFGETGVPLKDAQRELEEETGITDGDWHDLGTLHANSGLLATPIHAFLALVSTTLRTHHHTPTSEEEEVSAFRWWGIEQLASAIVHGQVADGITLAALMKAAMHGYITLPGQDSTDVD